MKEVIKKYRIVYIVILIVFIFISSGILATITDTFSITNHLNIDTVDIVLNQKMIKDNQKVKFINDDFIMPGQTISFIPNISNVGVDCFVRVKLEVDNLTYDDFNGFDEKWKFNSLDNYFYYTEVLSEEKSIEVFQSFMIPENWNNEMSDKKINIDLIAEAIQSRNFDPDFQSNDPWHGEQAEKTVRSRIDRKVEVYKK